MRMIIDLRDETHNKFKDICYKIDTSMSKVVRDFIEQYVEADELPKENTTSFGKGK
jgi:antitoxin component of RelBE/YafQ-DinJ toxin-antitoxin module